MPRSTYLFFLLLSFLIACQGQEDPVTPTAPSVEKALSAPLPDLIFTNLSQISASKESPVIMERLRDLIDASPAKADIHLNIFLFSHQTIIDALQRASDRGVKLHLMLDLSRDESLVENPMTISKLKRFLKPTSEIVTITSDASSSSINHNKFALFSNITTATGPKEKVVFQTSHNFTVADSKKIQDAVMLANAGLYGAYLTFWQDMKDKAVSGMKDFYYREYHDPAVGISALFFPKRRNGTSYGADTILEILDGLSEPATARIQIGMSDWTASRTAIITKLEQLREQGATIEVIAKDKVDPEVLDGLARLKAKGAYVKVYDMSQINNHAKFMLIRGKWKGENVNLMVTGSHNFTGNALRNNNETLLLLKNHTALFDTYTAFYQEMKKLPGQ
ncbi:phospholipase D-like domain-containing protein [Rufibacter radiotolerans]|nr:phospholipase D-like domain-containing protein [Rufibacter radiotolerans]